MASAALAPYSDPSVQCRSCLPRVQSPSSEASAKCSAGGCLRARGWLTTPTTRGVLSTRRAPAGSAPRSKATSRSGVRKIHTPSSTVRFIRTRRALLQADAGLSPSPPPVAVCGRCCKAPPVVRKLQERKLTLDVTGLAPRRNQGLYWPGSAAQVADWRRLAGAWGGLWHDLVPTQPPDSHQLAEAGATLFSTRPLGQAAVYEEGRLVLRCRLRLLGRCARHCKRRACRAPAAVG